MKQDKSAKPEPRYAKTEAGDMLARLHKRLARLDTISVRREAERKRDALTRELCLVSILSRTWPSFLAPPQRQNDEFPYVVHLETPAGMLVYRIAVDELPLFEHLPRKAEPVRTPAGDKLAILHALATAPS